jgi:phage tail-like protein
MPIIGTPRNYFKKFKFIVEIGGVSFAGFQKAGPLEAEVAVVEQHEGGVIIPDKSPGRVKVSNITLERGATTDFDLFNWFQQVANIAANGGLVTPQYKRTFDLVQQERDNTTLRRWRARGAWPIKFKAGDWDNSSDENVVEMVELAIDWFDPV